MTVARIRCCDAASNAKILCRFAAVHDNFFSSSGKFFQFCLWSFGVHNGFKAIACRKAGAGDGQWIADLDGRLGS
ncbi:hypothetical protein MKK55_19295 [Methylobacterium sp. J-059]|uniref:hypothetical protein n=1 Tax=Methylobacterium sp. J-059 TaxID=2836643 RepID=UPI001FB9F838|nr:hypothetical protein [Methylobacterium sp. J-059]MCJ2041079.1 hypothetical protein [Methylobacterium sp. J-059]